MKKIFYLLLIIILVFLIAFVSAFIFISIKGKTIATHKLEEIFNREVKIGSINVSFPLDLRIASLDIENFLKVDEIYVSFGVIDLLKRNIKVPGLKLLRPQLIIERSSTPEVIFKDTFSGRKGDLLKDEDHIVSSTAKDLADTTVSSSTMSIIINKLIVKDGKIEFIDKTLTPETFQLDITNVNIKAYRVSFPPEPSSMQFELVADILAGTDESLPSTIKGGGWINLIRKDMQGNIEIANLDATYFSPYYQKFLSRKLKSANVNFESDLAAKDNSLTADCHLKIKDLLFEEFETEELSDIKILDIIGGSLAQKSRDIELDFLIKTKLDNPKIDSAQIRGMVLDKVIETAISQPPEETIEDIKDIGEKIKDIGRELEDKFKGIFKKDKE